MPMRRVHETPRCDVTESTISDFSSSTNREASFVCQPKERWLHDFFLSKNFLETRQYDKLQGRKQDAGTFPLRTYSISHVRAFTIIGCVHFPCNVRAHRG